MTTQDKKQDDWNWGQDSSDFPTGQWDDFDGEFDLFEYETSETYGTTQIVGVLKPEDYEYEARFGLGILDPEEVDPEDDNSWPNIYLSMGGKEYKIIKDGLEVIGPSPNRRSRAVRFLTGANKILGLNLRSSSLEPFQGVKAHFKATTETNTNRDTGETTSRDILYVVGKPIGSAAILEEKEEKSGRSSRRSRRASNNEMEASPELLKNAIGLIVSCVADAGNEGLIRNRLSPALLELEDDKNKDMIELAAKRDTLTKAIDSNVIIREGQKLLIPS